MCRTYYWVVFTWSPKTSTCNRGSCVFLKPYYFNIDKTIKEAKICKYWSYTTVNLLEVECPLFTMLVVTIYYVFLSGRIRQHRNTHEWIVSALVGIVALVTLVPIFSNLWLLFSFINPYYFNKINNRFVVDPSDETTLIIFTFIFLTYEISMQKQFG